MTTIERDVHALILRYSPSSWRLEDLRDDLPLAGDGIGLDSVKLVELLCTCEERFGVHLPLESVAAEVLTVGGLARRIADARTPPAPRETAEDSG